MKTKKVSVTFSTIFLMKRFGLINRYNVITNFFNLLERRSIMVKAKQFIKKINRMLYGVDCEYRACCFCEESKCTYDNLEDVEPNDNCAHFTDETK